MKTRTFLSALLVSVAFLGSFGACQEAATATADATQTEASSTPQTTTTHATDDSASSTDPNVSAEAVKETVTEEAAAEEAAGESTKTESSEDASAESETSEPVQSGPLIDLLGPTLYSMKILDEEKGQLNAHYTNEALAGKKVIGLYFSADWCGPCRQFTPELVSFYDRMNNRRGKKDQFQVVFVSRCRDANSYVQYFAQMPWLALPPEEASGVRGQMLGDKYKTKGIPHLVLIDDLGQTITIDARNKIPQDKAGIGFPWRSPLAQLYTTILPSSLRLMIKSQIDTVKTRVVQKFKTLIGLGRKQPMST